MRHATGMSVLVARQRRAVLLLLVLLLPIAAGWSPARALPGNGSVRGQVVDRNGNTLAGVTLVLENASLGFEARGAVTNAQGVPCSPCGACRQVIYEFGPEAVVFYQGKKGWTESPITDLLPEGFRLK